MQLVAHEVLEHLLATIRTQHDTTFAHVIEHFQGKFSKQEHQRVALVLKYWLEDGVVAQVTDVCTAYYVLYYIYQQHLPLLTPNTVSCMYSKLAKKSKDLHVHYFILKLWTNQIVDVWRFCIL